MVAGVVINKVTLLLQDFSTDCGICYAYRFDDEVSDQSCDDLRCVQTFHTSCLVEVCALPSYVTVNCELLDNMKC